MVFFGDWYTRKRNSTENKPNISECHMLNEPPQINSAYFPRSQPNTPEEYRPIFWKMISRK